jgi:hypothetical protein
LDCRISNTSAGAHELMTIIAGVVPIAFRRGAAAGSTA